MVSDLISKNLHFSFVDPSKAGNEPKNPQQQVLVFVSLYQQMEFYELYGYLMGSAWMGESLRLIKLSFKSRYNIFFLFFVYLYC